MTTPTNPVLHVPAHKQTSPAAKPGQVVNPLPSTSREPQAKLDEAYRAYLKAKAELHPFSTL